MAQPSFRQTVRKIILSIDSIVIALVISIIYFSFSALILNYRFVSYALLGNHPVFYKFRIIYELIIGSYSALSRADFYLLAVTSFLVGMNILMIIKVLKNLNRVGNKLTLAVGGSTVLGVFVAGCTSCGFSVISLLGVTGAVSFIPFGGLGLHLLIVAFLVFSLFYSLRTYHAKIACKLT